MWLVKRGVRFARHLRSSERAGAVAVVQQAQDNFTTLTFDGIPSELTARKSWADSPAPGMSSIAARPLPEFGFDSMQFQYALAQGSGQSPVLSNTR